MKLTRVFWMVALVVLTLGAAQVANADILTFQLTQDNCTDGCNPSPPNSMGTITVTDISGGVSVVIDLVSPLKFVNTGIHETIDFNLASGVTGVVSIGTISDSDFSLSPKIGGNHFDGFGDFQYAIMMNTPQGAGGAQPEPLTFTLLGTGLAANSFVGNTGGWYWGVDVINPNKIDSEGKPGVTGPIGARGPEVPEPASMLLLAAGGLGLLGFSRFRK